MNFTSKQLAALSLFASTDESRYALTGVFFESHKDSNPIAVATDGRLLVAIEGEREDCDTGASVILTTSVLEALIKIGHGGSIGIEIGDPIRVNIGESKMSFSGDDFEVKALYPNWRQVVPRQGECNNTSIPYPIIDGYYWNKITKAAEILGSGHCNVRFSGVRGPLEVCIQGVPNFYAVMMPMFGGEFSNEEFIKRINQR